MDHDEDEHDGGLHGVIIAPCHSTGGDKAAVVVDRMVANALLNGRAW